MKSNKKRRFAGLYAKMPQKKGENVCVLFQLTLIAILIYKFEFKSYFWFLKFMYF